MFQQKLRIWRLRDLTIIGRIQIEIQIIIPIFQYRASLVLVNGEFVKDANKITFGVIRRGKDKVKRFALTSEIEDGGLQAPHLDSITETQRVLCVAKKVASDQPSNWKKICLHSLQPAGGKFILCCDFDSVEEIAFKACSILWRMHLKVSQNVPHKFTGSK